MAAAIHAVAVVIRAGEVIPEAEDIRVVAVEDIRMIAAVIPAAAVEDIRMVATVRPP